MSEYPKLMWSPLGAEVTVISPSEQAEKEAEGYRETLEKSAPPEADEPAPPDPPAEVPPVDPENAPPTFGPADDGTGEGPTFGPPGDPL